VHSPAVEQVKPLPQPGPQVPPQPSVPHSRPAHDGVQHVPERQTWPAVQHDGPHTEPVHRQAPPAVQV
jgi:hypothetical protein